MMQHDEGVRLKSPIFLKSFRYKQTHICYLKTNYTESLKSIISSKKLTLDQKITENVN